MIHLFLKEDKRWLGGDKIIIRMLRGRRFRDWDYAFDWLQRILRLIKSFYDISTGNLAVLGSLCKTMEARLKKEKELSDIYTFINSLGHEHIPKEKSENLMAREKELRNELGRPHLD